MLIPHQQLSSEALNGVIEEFIGREGTDYGAHEFSLTEKTAQVLQQIHLGQVVVVFDARMEQVTLMTQRDWCQINSLAQAQGSDDQ
jgi:uncharacterized protein